MSEERKLPLPTRDGIATGGANERVMASKVDPTSIRTVIRTHADGSETRLRTRGGSLEYVTVLPPPEERKREDCEWSFDLYPLKRDENGDLIADTILSGGELIVNSDLGTGAKTRRRRLTRNEDGTFSPKLMESEFDAEPDPTEAIRGVGRWYWRDKLVTWTVHTLIPYPPYGAGWAVIGVVRYGRVMLPVTIMQNFMSLGSTRIYAACTVKGDDGKPYLRVAVGRSDGIVEGYAIEVRDYTLQGDLVWSQTFGYPNGGGGWYPDGGSFQVLVVLPDAAAFSPNGRRLIIAAQPTTRYAKAVLFDISRPAVGYGDPIVAVSLYSPPVTVPDDVTIDTDVTTPWGSSTPVEIPGLSSPVEDPADTTCYEYHVGPYGDNREIDEHSHVYSMTLRAVGFTKGNVEAAVVKVSGVLDLYHTTTKNHTEQHDVYSDVTSTTFWSAMQERWVTVVYPAARSFMSLTGTSEQSGWHQRGEHITLSYCEGTDIRWEDTKELMFGTAFTGYDTTYAHDEWSRYVDSGGGWHSDLTVHDPQRRTIHSEGTHTPGAVTAEYAPITVDFLDRAAVVVWWTQPGAYTDHNTTAVHNIETGIWEDNFGDGNDFTTIMPKKDWVEHTMQVRTGQNGDTSKVDVFKKKPLHIADYTFAFCSAGWCPKGGKSALVMERRDDGDILVSGAGTETPVAEYLFGRYFRGGEWYPVVLSPDEPAQTVDMDGLKVQVSPYA